MPACQSCGEPNEATARFCHACGEALVEELEPPLEVRKTVTVLFADVAGSTALGEQLDPEPLRQVMSRYFDEMRAVLVHYGGTVEKFIGDAVMAVFGVPIVHEDDALRAVRAADQMLDRLELLNAELEPEYGIRLEMRIGINMGEVVAGTASAGQTLVTGDAVNLAKRLEQAAPAGAILIGKSMYPLVKDAVEVGPLESFKVKGKVDPVSPLLLESVDQLAPGVARRFDRPLVNRRDELAALQAAFELSAAERACRRFTVLGPVGIGKSRLISEFVETLGSRATVVSGRCLPYGEAITFWPLREIVRVLGGAEGIRAAVADTPDGELVTERVLAAVGASPDSVRGEEAAWAFRKLFESLARERPVVVVLEDLHWAASTLLDLVEYLLGWSQGPILLLCLARPDLIERRPNWAHLRQTADALVLEPLSEPEAALLLQQLRRGGTDDGASQQRITDAAEGNPLFLEQLAAMLAEAEGSGDALAIPASIQAVLAERLDQLNPEERAVIERGAVIGREFSREAVVELSPPGRSAAVASHLMALVRRELIRPDTSGVSPEDSFRFQHILIRDAAYEALPKRVRADLHERVARSLEARQGDELELEEITGHHFEQAFRYRLALGPRDEDVAALGASAARHLGRAGERALAGGDASAAANLLSRASAAVDESDPSAPDLLASLGMALTATGELETALEALGDAVERAEASGDRRTRERAAVECTRIGFLTGRIGPDEAAAEANRAISELESLGDDLGLAKAWLLLVFVHNWRLEYSALERAAERARFHGQRAGAARDTADALVWVAPATVLGPRTVADGVEQMERLRSEAPGPLAEAAALLTLGCLGLMGGETDSARDCYRRSEAIYRDLGIRLFAAAQASLTGWAELVAGDVELAEALLRSGYAELEEMGERGLLSSTAAELGRVLCEKGSFEEAAQFAAMAEELSGPGDAANASLIAGIRARVLASSGDWDDAVREAEEAVARVAAGDCLELSADAHRALADAMSAAGRDDDARAAVEEALRLYDTKGNDIAAQRLRASLLRV